MRIVIMGCGRVGAHLANTMHREHDITIIDQSAHAFERLSPEFSGRTVYDHDRDDTYHELGLDTICPTEAGARLLQEIVESESRK